MTGLAAWALAIVGMASDNTWLSFGAMLAYLFDNPNRTIKKLERRIDELERKA